MEFICKNCGATMPGTFAGLAAHECGPNHNKDKMPPLSPPPPDRLAIAGAALARVRPEVFEVLRRHNVSDECFAEVAVVTHALGCTDAMTKEVG